jgi:hypothetical protein
VNFPSFTPPDPSLSQPPPTWTDGPSRIPAHFVNLRRPSDVTLDTLALLNISLSPECDFETLLSSLSNDGRAFLPPKSWLQVSDQKEPEHASTAEPSVTLLNNGRRAPDRNEFYTCVKELFFENEEAFSNLSRKPIGEKVPLRLATFRKFWESLDNMAYYWDNSLDEYISPKVEDATKSKPVSQEPSPVLSNNHAQDGGVEIDLKSASDLEVEHWKMEERRKKAKIEAASDGTATPPLASFQESFPGGLAPVEAAMGNTPSAQSRSISSSKSLPARIAPPKVPWAMNIPSIAERPVDLSQGSYRGYRIGNGAQMPDQYRLDTVRAFIEPIAWAFGVTLLPHRRPPVLCLEQIRFPVRMNSVGWRGHSDRVKARQGWLEGPVFGVQCRPEVNFGSSGNLEAESVLDVVRELGGMLLLAQERLREGKTETRAGEGKWWVTAQRWGGGPGGEVGELPSFSEHLSQNTAAKSDEKSAVRSRTGLRERKRPSPAELWKTLKPSNPLWDSKTVYEAIGTDRSSDWDDVSCIRWLVEATHLLTQESDIHDLIAQSSH